MSDSRSLHEVIGIIDVMCDMQVNGMDSAIPYLRGNPGGGKTESIRAMAAENGDEFISCHFALKQPEDLGGIPQFTTFEHGKEKILSTKWSIPEILETLIKTSEKARAKKKKVIFFLDDIHRSGPFHVTALFELLSERKIRDIALPDNVAIVLAGNGSIKAGAQLTNSAIINRCSVFDVYTDFDYWSQNFAIPNNFNNHIHSFLQNSRYRHFFHEEEDIEKPWGSPRSWTKLSNLVNTLFSKKTKMPADKLSYICQAHVGERAAKEFVAYYQLVSKFKIADIFKFINSSLGIKENEDIPGEKILETVDAVIKKTASSTTEELQFYAISHAALIEFLQKDIKERKKLHYVECMSVMLLSLEKNPKNPFPEMAISIFKELQAFLKSDPEMCFKIMTKYDEMAQKIGMPCITEMLNAITGLTGK